MERDDVSVVVSCEDIYKLKDCIIRANATGENAYYSFLYTSASELTELYLARFLDMSFALSILH